MVDCSKCEWKLESNSLSCKKNDSNVGWVNCDYRCTPFQGEKFEDNYFSENFKENYFCNGPTNENSCKEQNIKIKENFNTNKDICIFDKNICKITEDISLNDLIKNSNIYSLENKDIYNEELLENGNLKIIKNTEDLKDKLDNSSIISNCSIEELYKQNECEDRDINECEQLEGCAFDFKTNTCFNKRLILPNIEFEKFYNDLYSEKETNSFFNILYQRYQQLREIKNWPCLDLDIDFPYNCKNDDIFEKMYIKNEYKNMNDELVSIKISHNQLQHDRNMLIELINERCFNKLGINKYCLDFQNEANLQNIDKYASIIRNNTLSLFSELKPYTFEKIPYILIIEFQLFLETNENNNLEDIIGNVKDLNNLQLYSESTDILIQKIGKNQELKNCFNDIFYIKNEETLFDYILTNKLTNWENIHFEYIKLKIDKFIEIGPHSINNCFRLVDNINDSICNGEITTGLLEILFLITELIGIQIDINNINQNDPKFILLMDIVIPTIPNIVKKITDLTNYYENNNCGSLNNKSKILLEFYEKILQTNKPIINYNLFNNNMFNNFFSDFTKGNIYKKIILLIFIYLIISNLSSLFKK